MRFIVNRAGDEPVHKSYVMLKAQYRNYYYKNGSPVFVYHVIGTVQELAAYKTEQTANGFYREDTNEFTDRAKTVKNIHQGAPLYYSPRDLGNTANLEITFNGRVVPNDVSAARMQANKQQDYIMQERAKAIVARSGIGGGSVSAFSDAFRSADDPAVLQQGGGVGQPFMTS